MGSQVLSVEFTQDELTRLCWLRAVEWLAWPAFMSQTLLPILYLFYPVYWVLLGVMIVCFIWLPIRHRLASFRLATIGCLFVRLKWATIPAGIVLLLMQERYLTAAIALATPWLAAYLNFPAQIVASRVGYPSEIGIVQERFLARALGESQEQP